MDKNRNRKSHRISGTKETKIGIPLCIHDKNRIEIKSGDKIRWNNYECIVLWNQESKSYFAYILNSQWYNDNIYDCNSYGKGFEMIMDEGARMNIEII